MSRIDLKEKVIGILIILVIFNGCGKWPEIANNKKDIVSLPENLSSVRVRGLSDNDIPYLVRFKNLTYLDFGGGAAVEEARITDQGLVLLSKISFPALETVKLSYCRNITDVGLSYIAKNQTISWLSLMGCQKVTDKGLLALVPMSQLRSLDLRGCCGFTDAGLTYLATMTNLTDVLLGGCANVTAEGINSLQAHLPKCRIEKDEKEWQGHIKDYIGNR